MIANSLHVFERHASPRAHDKASSIVDLGEGLALLDRFIAERFATLSLRAPRSSPGFASAAAPTSRISTTAMAIAARCWQNERVINPKTDRRESGAPRALSTVDSGARLYWQGKMYFRQLDALTITVSTARDFDDGEWFAFLEDTLAIARELRVTTKVSMVCSVYAHPNARQRKAMSEFFARHRLEKLERIALVTDNVIVRGALIAFGWIVPNVRVNAFRSADAESGLRWLHEAFAFNESEARLAWQDALTTLGIHGESIRPAPVD